MLEMTILETQISGRACHPLESLRLWHSLCSPFESLPLDPQEISHAQQFFNLGISGVLLSWTTSCEEMTVTVHAKTYINTV